MSSELKRIHNEHININNNLNNNNDYNNNNNINNNDYNNNKHDVVLEVVDSSAKVKKPSILVFILLAAGVNGFFILNGLMEEYAFNVLPKFEYGWFVTFFELLVFGLIALGENYVNHKRSGITSPFAPWKPSINIKYFFYVAIYMTAARGLTNVSLQYLNYATQVVFKSLKLLTVMIGSILYLKKTYTYYDYFSVVFLVISAILVTLGDSSSMPEFNLTGIVIVVLSLVFDSLQSNGQEYILQTYNASVSETLVYTNLLASAMTFVYIIFTGEFFKAIEYCHETPMLYVAFAARAFVIYLGVLCFLQITKKFNVLLATTVTTVRKVLTVVISFIVYTKPFTLFHFVGIFFFVVGLFVGAMKARNR